MDRQGPGAPARAHPVQLELAALLKLAAPVVLARLGIMAMGLTDALVVGRYSAVQLGFHAQAWAPTSVVVTMAIGLLTGVQVMTARTVGQGAPAQAGAVLRRGLVYSLWIGGIAGVGLALFGPWLLHALRLPPQLADGAAPVLRVFALSLPAYAVSVSTSFWMEGLGRPGPGAWGMWIANLVNLAVDLVLVPGAFGLPALGAMGGAWATTAARTFLALFMLVYIARMKEARALGVFTRPGRDRPAEIEQRRIGYGAGVSNLFESAAFASMTVIAGWVGGLATSAWAIVLNVAAIVFMVPLGLSTAAAVRVGQGYGARDPRAVSRAAAVAFLVTAVFGVLVGLVVWPSAGLIARSYTGNLQTVALARPALALACLMFLPDALQVVTAQSLRARGDVWLPTVTHLASYILIMAPVAWALALPAGFGVMGIAGAVVIASVTAAALLLGRFWILSRRGL